MTAKDYKPALYNVFVMRPTNRLRELRTKAKMTQAALADATGVSQPAISQIENGVLSMDLAWMRAFARVLGCTAADLLDDADHPYRLDEEEREIVDHFRSADELQREMIARVSAPARAYRPPPAEEEDRAA